MTRPDNYRNFSELERAEREGRDYRIHVRFGCSPVAVLAPHGGKIERGTMALAAAIAGHEHTFYCFEGIKPILKDNRVLHITSDHFDEPNALLAVAEADRVLTIHGATGGEPAVYAGGLDLELRRDILAVLQGAGINAMDDRSPTRKGRGASNICNRGRSGKGLQLELSFGLRKLLYERPNVQGLRPPTELFQQMVSSIRAVLSA